MEYETCPNISREDLKDVYYYDFTESLITIREKRANSTCDDFRQVIVVNRNKQRSIANHKRQDWDIVAGSRVLFKHNSKANKSDLNYLGPATVASVQYNHKLTVKLLNNI